MKLYTYAGAPNPRRVHIYLAEKGIEIPFEQVDIMKRANRTPEFMNRVAALANEYEIIFYNTLELLKVMYDCGHITIDQVRGIASYWKYLKDIPKSYRRDFKRLFGEPIP